MGAEDDDSYLSVSEILLVFKPFIHRQENLKSLVFSEFKEFPVLSAAQQRLGNCLALVTHKMVFEFPGKTLVQKDFHPS
ncbi:MAG: hypothetical protein WBQ43_17760 [Terriglobales bacterium]